MGRPKKDESEKKMQLNIRVKPSTKSDLEACADQEGCTVSAKAEQLIEAMLRLSNGADDETVSLLADIVEEIQTVQSITGGKWHKDLTTWAAVSEIFKGSPIKQKKPKDADGDPAVLKARFDFLEIVRERQSLIVMMQKFGIAINEKPASIQNALLVAAHPPTNFRDIEKQKIAELKDVDERRKAEMLFEMILDADQRAEAALDAWVETRLPYAKQEMDGEILYRNERRKNALAELRKGGTPDIEDL